MNITLKIEPLDAIPQNIIHIQEINMSLDQSVDDQKNVTLDLYFKTSKNVYHYTIKPENAHGTLSGLIGAIKEYLAENKVNSDDIVEHMEILYKASQYAIDHEEADVPPEKRVYYRLMNGSTIYTDGTKIDWKSVGENLQQMYQTVDNLRLLIRTLLLTDTIKTGEGDQQKDESSLEYVKNTVQHFFAENKMEEIDYSMFEVERVSDIDRLIVRLIDIMTIYSEQIVIGSSVLAQEKLIENLKKHQEQESGEKE